MTVTAAARTAMTSTTVSQHLQQQQKVSRISNFSVASLLADTRPTADTIIKSFGSPPSVNHRNNNNNRHSHESTTPTPIVDFLPTNLSQTSSSPVSHHDNSSTCTKNERHTPHSSTESDYDSNQEDSIVDIEDIRNDNNSTPMDAEKAAQQMLAASSALGGHVPIRPTPFSALAAAAAAWGGIGAGMPWPGARQMPPFGPPGLFPGQGFGTGPNGGKLAGKITANT